MFVLEFATNSLEVEAADVQQLSGVCLREAADFYILGFVFKLDKGGPGSRRASSCEGPHGLDVSTGYVVPASPESLRSRRPPGGPYRLYYRGCGLPAP